MKTRLFRLILLALLVWALMMTILFMRGASAQGIDPLVVLPQVSVGEQFIIQLTANGTGTISVTTPAGHVALQESFNWTATRTAQWVIAVSDSWGYGRGLVSASILDGTGNQTTLLRTFEVICPASCQVAIIQRGVAEAVTSFVILFAVALLAAILFVAHAAHVYRTERGELTWSERLTLLLRARIARDPDRRDWTDRTGSLPEHARAELQRLHKLANDLADEERAFKDSSKERRLLEAEAILRSRRIARMKGVLVAKTPPLVIIEPPPKFAREASDGGTVPAPSPRRPRRGQPIAKGIVAGFLVVISLALLLGILDNLWHIRIAIFEPLWMPWPSEPIKWGILILAAVNLTFVLVILSRRGRPRTG